MSPSPEDRREVRKELIGQFLRREIDWATVLAVWEPEPHEPPEPLDLDEELDKVRVDIVKTDHQIAMLRKSLRDSEQLRKEIEDRWREQPALVKELGAILKKLCAARQFAVERLAKWEKLREECVAFGLEIEGQKGAGSSAGNHQTESA
jgi:hypothetical protein